MMMENLPLRLYIRELASCFMMMLCDLERKIQV